ncbi:MAG: hypothetical protein M3Z02_05060 [Actinomycetota bacterium]|nr:hypothetical protein [Actinomycetota bacterium]
MSSVLLFCLVVAAVAAAGAWSCWQVRGRDVSDIDRFANARAVTSAAVPQRWAASGRPAAVVVEEKRRSATPVGKNAAA